MLRDRRADRVSAIPDSDVERLAAALCGALIAAWRRTHQGAPEETTTHEVRDGANGGR